MSGSMKLMVLLVETTSLPLLVLTLVMILSGYGMLYPMLIESLTLGLIGYGEAARIHTNPLIRAGFTLLALIHGLAGSILLVERYVKNPFVKRVIEYGIAFILLYIATTIIIAEIIF